MTPHPPFGALGGHAGRHPLWPHRFNPYNQCPTHRLHTSVFNAVLQMDPADCGLIFAHFFTGLIDAPEDIPMGATECIRTVGGYYREEYMGRSVST